jgi:TetR/AcrR family transcriptional repressor of mexAB-oprM operon
MPGLRHPLARFSPKQSMRRTKEDAEKTRTSILAAAEVLFMEKGVAHTSLEHIARAAGVTRGAVYWHFENKAHLFNDMLNQVRLPPEQLAERLSSDPELSLQSLCNLCIGGLKLLTQSEQKRRLLTILMHRCEFTEDLREAEERNNQFIQQFIDICERLLTECETRGQLHSGISAFQASRAVHGMLIGLISDWLRAPHLFDPERDATPMFEALFRGLIRDPLHSA